MLKWIRRSIVTLAVGSAVVAYAWLGVFTVNPDEQAVVLRLGIYDRTLGEGIKWHAPFVEQVYQRQVTTTVEQEFGYRVTDPGPPPVSEDRPEERRMLSSDANIVDVEFVVQYRISNLKDYLFGVPDPPAVLADTAQAVMREEVAQRPVDEVLTEGRGVIEVAAKDRIQELLDTYGVGIEVQNLKLSQVDVPEEVKEAFADVASAEQDREREILDARGYADQVVPRARGEKEEILNQARAYEATRTQTAIGEASKFTALLEQYRKAPQVTRQRLYLETLEEILPRMEKVIIDQKVSDRVLPYLPLGPRGVQR
jgi:membrane protease subunit HflK